MRLQISAFRIFIAQGHGFKATLKKMKIINIFQRSMTLASMLHAMPMFGFLAWLLYDDFRVFAFSLATLMVVVQLTKNMGLWFRWVRSYAVCACGAFIYLLFHAIGLIVNARGVVDIFLSGGFAFLGMLMITFMFVSSLDLASFLGRRKFPVRESLLLQKEPSSWPSVCFQVPTYDEPPELVSSTIKQLLLQDYPGRWMIQVIDNNTPDASTWEPVRDLCVQFGKQIDFMHLDRWPGYKAGALNEGIRRLPGWVEHIAIVDADYLVDVNFLRMVLPHMSDPSVAYVQTPQSYRNWSGSRFLQSVFYNYEEYFQTRKPARGEINGIICVGTMAVIRRTAIEAVGVWDEASCTEDAELSVRLLGSRWRGVFDHRAKGYGLMPLDFNGMRKQRFRWAFGMIHLFRKHRRLLFGFSSGTQRLTLAQRLSFWGLANQFLSELVPFMYIASFIVLAAVSSFAGSIEHFLPLLLLPTIAFSLYIWGSVLRIMLATRHSNLVIPIVGSVVVAFSISWVIAWACICGLVSNKVVFLRTPKTVTRESWWSALQSARIEMALASCCVMMLIWACAHLLIPLMISTSLLIMIFGSAPVIAVTYARHYGRLDNEGHT